MERGRAAARSAAPAVHTANTCPARHRASPRGHQRVQSPCTLELQRLGLALALRGVIRAAAGFVQADRTVAKCRPTAEG